MNFFDLFKKPVERVQIPIDWEELTLQSISNVHYLRAHIRSLDSTIEDLKNKSARSNRDRIKKLESTRDWMKRKLKEEEVCHVEYLKKI